MSDLNGHETPGGGIGSAIVLVVIAGGAAAGATQTDETGPILAFVGALLVVAVTAITSSRRLDRQLLAESQRNSERVRAEGDRLQLRLDHERKLADIEHLRDLLDSAAAAFDVFHTSLSRHEVALQHNNTEARRQTTMGEIHDAIIKLGVELRRLELRFSPQHEIALAYNKVQAALHQRTALLIDTGGDQVLTVAQVETSERLMQASLSAFRLFADAARGEIGVVVTVVH